ncbi:MAG: DsbA family protein [Deltaproteobacteria bacterium]|nr:DsbA family protein [Deltaproteobacteria bacterium]
MSRRLAAVILGLAGIGAVTSAYLAYAHLRLHRSLGFKSLCSISERWSCDAVALSPWSWFAGMPVAAHGLWFYLLVVVLALAALSRWNLPFPRSVAAVTLAASVFSVAVSLALASISLLALDAFCPLCLGLYSINLALLLCAWAAVRRTGETGLSALRAEWRFWRRRQGRALLVAGGAALPLLLGMVAWPSGFSPVASICAVASSERDQAGRGTRPIKLDVYLDFQCPHCKQANRALSSIRSRSKVLVRHRQFPLDSKCNPLLSRQYHPGACLQAAAAICAEGLGRGDEFRVALFEGGARTESGLVALAASVGAPDDGFRACLHSDETKRRLTDDIEQGIRLGVEGTPALFVHERRYLGPVDPAAFSCLEQR